jgi:hypothetical protein
MGNYSRFIAAGFVLFFLLTGCQTGPSTDPVILPTSAGTSAAASTVAPLALPTIIQDTATPLPPEFPDEPGEFFFDDFSNRNSGWFSGTETEASWDYYQSGYKVSVYGDEIFSLSTIGVDYQNVRLVVDARMIGGQTHNFIGLTCRGSGFESYYAAGINGAGYYGIFEGTGEGEAKLLSGDGSQNSVVINQDYALNLIEMACIGNKISLKVNGQLLIEVTDSTLKTGDVGFFVGTFSAESTDALFDNFYIYLEE